MRFFYPQRLRPLLMLAVLLLLGAGQSLFAQAPTWANSPGQGEGRSTAVDGAGNVYVTGNFYGTAIFGTTTLTSVGGADVFVAKLTSSGMAQWVVQAGGSGNDFARDLAVDGGGNVAVTGVFSGPAITFGTTTLTNAGNTDAFVAKITSVGNWQWANGLAGSGNEDSNSVAVDGSGNVVITGQFTSPTLAFGTTTLISTGYDDLFVAELTPSGVWRWAAGAEGSSAEVGISVVVDGSSNVVVSGVSHSPTLTFANTTLTNTTGYLDFVAKLTPAGVWQWAASAVVGRSTYGSEARDMAVDNNGNVVVTGFFQSPTITFGTITLTNAGDCNIFVAKLSAAGNWQWATGAGGGDRESGYGVAIDGGGNVVITGEFSSPTLSFGATTLANAGNDDVFVAMLTPAGAWQGAISAGGSGYDSGNSVAVDGSGNVVVTGVFLSPTFIFDNATLINSSGSGEIFLARLSTANGLPEDPSQPAFTLTPNPARTTVQVTGAAGTTATLLDGLGRVVGTAAISPAGTATLAVGILPAGLYLVRVGTSKAQRLVVE